MRFLLLCVLVFLILARVDWGRDPEAPRDGDADAGRCIACGGPYERTAWGLLCVDCGSRVVRGAER